MPDFTQWRPRMAALLIGVGLLTGQWFLAIMGGVFALWSWNARPCILCRAGFCDPFL